MSHGHGGSEPQSNGVAGDHLRRPNLYNEVRRMAEMLKDPEVLREHLAAGAGPDGTVESRLTPEAWGTKVRPDRIKARAGR